MSTLIIGGGASGLMAACRVARAGGEALLLEAQPRVGRKLLATGNGRCNFTNMGARAENYFGARGFASAVLNACPPERVAEALRELGVPAFVDAEMRAYPASNQASSVLDALRFALEESGGAIVTDFRADAISRGDRFSVRSKTGVAHEADNVIIAVGGLAAPKLGASGEFLNALLPFGHRLTPRFPALAPLIADVPRALKGQRVRCEITLLDGEKAVKTETGEALFTEYGVSGIAAMQLSRHVRGLTAPRLEIDLAPGADVDIDARALLLPNRAVEDFLNGLLPRLLGASVMRAAGVSDMKKPARELSRTERVAVGRAVKHYIVPVKGVCGFDQAQVTAGGLDMRDFEPSTMESRRVPGLYAVGEACDVDGECGGFNLQWAFSSAIVAAEAVLAKSGRIK